MFLWSKNLIWSLFLVSKFELLVSKKWQIWGMRICYVFRYAHVHIHMHMHVQMPILGNFSSFWALQACWQRELFYPKITMRPYPPFASFLSINLIWVQSFCLLLNSYCKHNKSEILPFSLFDSDPCCRIFQRFRRFHSRPCPFDHNQCLKRKE